MNLQCRRLTDKRCSRAAARSRGVGYWRWDNNGSSLRQVFGGVQSGPPVRSASQALG